MHVFSPTLLKRKRVQGAWVAQSVERLTLDFGSGHDLTFCEFEPCIGLCTDSVEPACDSLSPSLSLSLSLSLPLPPQINKNNLKRKRVLLPDGGGSEENPFSLLLLLTAGMD